MSARVAVNSRGQWVSYCQPCGESVSGSMVSVYLWSDVHNSDKHKYEDKP